MRKFTAVVLAVLMLVSVLAVLPVSAAARTTYDGTTKDTAGINQVFITEVASITQRSTFQKLFNFVELYNNGANSVDLSTLSLLRAVRMFNEPDDDADPYFTNKTAAGKKFWRVWRDEYKFLSKIDIKAGKIVDDDTARLTGEFTDSIVSTPEIDGDKYFDYLTNNGVDMNLANGENAVIWFVGPTTMAWMKSEEALNPNFDPRTAFVEHYYGEEAVASNFTIVMVWAWSEYELVDGGESEQLADDMFTLNALPEFTNKNFDYILGVAKNTWNLDEDQAYVPATKTCHSDLYSMTVLGASVPRYSFSTANANLVENVTATFAPSTAKPYIANAYEALAAIGTPTVYSDYFEAGYVESYRETGAIDWASQTTPGTMPVWQWAMIDPGNANAPAELKTDGAADAAKVQAAVDAKLNQLKLLDDGASDRDEDDEREYNFQLQEDLRNQFFGKKEQNTEEEGFPLVALILIIVGGVLVVGGGAAAVIFLVVLPKKKKAAAAAATADAADTVAEDDAPAEE